MGITSALVLFAVIWTLVFLIALPIFAFYLGVTLFTRVEANWSIAAPLSST